MARLDTHDQLIKKLMRRPGVRTEVERNEREESTLLDALIKAQQGRKKGVSNFLSAKAARSFEPFRSCWDIATSKLQ